MSAPVVGWLMLACLSVGFLLGACWHSAQSVKAPADVPWMGNATAAPVEPWRAGLEAAAAAVVVPKRPGGECNCFACKPLP